MAGTPLVEKYVFSRLGEGNVFSRLVETGKYVLLDGSWLG